MDRSVMSCLCGMRTPCIAVNPRLLLLPALTSQLLLQPVSPTQYAEWVAEVMAMKEEHPLAYPHHEDVIMPQWAIEVRSVE